MGPTFTIGAGLIGLAWLLFRRTFRRSFRAKFLPPDKALTVREPDELSILTYNVLADNIVRANPTYNYADDLFRSWEYRFDKLKEHITAMNPDIVCLQELEMVRWGEWREFMDNLGYTGVMLRRDRAGRRAGRHHSITNATFFRARRFRLRWEQHCNRTLGIAVTWFAANGQEHMLYVVNVHLEGHPYKPAERVSQVNAMLRHVERDQEGTDGKYDIVFCGDFNSTRWNAPWHYLYCGRLEAGYTEPCYPDIQVVKESIAHPFAFNDVYKTAEAIPEFTARAPRRRTEADFIFASRHLRIAAVLRAVDPRLIPYVDRSLLPNKRYPSDHLPIGVVLLQPKASEAHLREGPSTRRNYNQSMDTSFFEGTSGSVASDSVNNVELHASMESLDSNGGFMLHAAESSSPQPVLDETALT